MRSPTLDPRPSEAGTQEAAAAPAVLRGRFAAGTAVAGPGEKAFGYVPVALSDGEELRVPCWVLRGRAPRGRALADEPVLYVHSTQHGNEISGIEVVRRVAQALDPGFPPRHRSEARDRLRGTLVAVPIANPLAFRWRRHHYLQGPEEAYQGRPELDVDHFWPGDPAGTHVQRLAYALWQHGVRHATHVLDLHTWNRWQAAATTVRGWHAPSLALAKAFGLWVQARWQPTAADRATDETGTGSVTGVAIRHGKAACSPNFTGQWDIYEPQVRRGVRGLRAVLRHLDMLPRGDAGGAPASPATANSGEASAGHAGYGRAAPPVFTTDELIDVAAPAAGIFLPRVQPEARVARGQPLGVLVRLDNFAPVEVPAPIDALVYLVGAITSGADVALPSMMPTAAAGGRVARLLPVRPDGGP